MPIVRLGAWRGAMSIGKGVGSLRLTMLRCMHLHRKILRGLAKSFRRSLRIGLGFARALHICRLILINAVGIPC